MKWAKLPWDKAAQWVPLPGTLVVLKGSDKYKKDTMGNCHAKPNSEGPKGWQWIAEAEDGDPVLVTRIPNPYCIEIWCQKGAFHVMISHIDYMLIPV